MSHLNLQNIISALSVILLTSLIYYLINIGNKFVNENQRIVIRRDFVVRVAIVLGSLFILYLAFKNFPIITRMIQTLLMALVIAFIINPLVNFFEKKGINRSYSIILVYLIVLGALVVVVWAVAPKIGQEFKNLLMQLPGIISSLQAMIQKQLENIAKDNTRLLELTKSMGSSIEGVISSYTSALIVWLTSMADKFPKIYGSAIRIVLVPIFAFYILIDKEKLLKGFEDAIPKKHKKTVLAMSEDINNSLSEFVRGRVVMAIFVGILTAIVLLLLDIDFAIVIGIVTMVADIIPYIGPFLGFLPAVVMALMQSTLKGFWVAVIFVFIQWLENNILAPKILGKSTGLKPYVVLLALIVGGDIAGVWGMIFSVPVVSTLKIVFKYAKPVVERNIKRIFNL